MSISTNVLFIICDDLAYGDLSSHGNRYTRTPHLDALYTQSTRLTRYGSGPLCTPARASLMTGRYPYRTGAYDTYLGRSMLHHDEMTVAEVLQSEGYATCLSGKWHLGDTYPMRPNDKGFGDTLYHLGGGLRQPANLCYPEDSYFDPLLMRNGEPIGTRGYCTDVFTDHAIEFISSHTEDPWFVYLAFNAPHTPLEIDGSLAEHYRSRGVPEATARLYGMVDNIDANVGRLLQRLDDLGIADDTLVVFTSDHGPCSGADVQGKSRYNTGLRGRKGTMYEGGLSVPCFVRYTGRITASIDLDRIANPIDWLPTLADFTGASTPDDRTIDGRSLAGLLNGDIKQSDWPDRQIYYQWHRGNLPDRGRNCAVVTQRFKWCRPGPDAGVWDPDDWPEELYDLEHDLGEITSIAEDQRGLCDRLRDDYDAWFDDVCGTRGLNTTGTFAPPRIVVGADASPLVVLSQQDWISDHGEHWKNDDRHGYWLIDVREPGPYDVEIVLPPEQPCDRLAFRCGGELEPQMDLDHNSGWLKGVMLPIGLARLDCYRLVGDEAKGVHFVKILPSQE
jgi:arylsulfatase A-like enzyme